MSTIIFIWITLSIQFNIAFYYLNTTNVFPSLIGINFHSYGSSAYQNRFTPLPPRNYVEDSFRIFADNEITCIRITFCWESYELDLNRFRADLKHIADIADKYGIKCIYDNHQWECSSWIGYGIGIPNSLISTFSVKRNAENIPDCRTKKDFWNRWWNRTIKTKDGVDGWNAQLSILER